MAQKKIMRHASALKAKRQNVVRRAKNSSTRSRIRNLAAAVLKAVADKNKEQAQSTFRQAQSAWRKAAKNNVVHPNTADRQISRLSQRVASLAKS